MCRLPIVERRVLIRGCIEIPSDFQNGGLESVAGILFRSGIYAINRGGGVPYDRERYDRDGPRRDSSGQ